MPIYLAESVKGTVKPSPALENRGLDMKSVPMSRVDPIGAATYDQPAYRAYVAALPAFLYAAMTNQTVSTTWRGYELKTKAAEQVPLPFPTTVISFATPLNAQMEEALKGTGAEVIEVKSGSKKRSVYRYPEGSFNLEHLGTVSAHPNNVEFNTPVTYGQCNLQGIFAFLQARGILTAFLKTQYYGAFTGPCDPPHGAFEAIRGFGSLKRTADASLGGRKAKKGKGKEGEAEEEDEDEELDEVEGMGEYRVAFEEVIAASPPPAGAEGFGSLATMPTTSGNLFPFFDELVDDDGSYVSSCCREFFLMNFGTNPKDSIANYLEFKSRIVQTAATRIGRALTHIFAGVRLAIQTQSRLYLHLGTSYNGFTLHGYYYTILVGPNSYSPVLEDVLREEASEIDLHTVSLAKILLIAAKSRRGKSMKVADRLKASQVTGPRRLAEYLRGLNLTADEIEEIDKLSSNLSFPQKFWRFTADRILEAVNLLVDGAEPPSDAPMYFSGGLLTTSNFNLRVFTLFGDHGFSFRCPGGKTYKLPAKKEEDTLFKPYKVKPSDKKTIQPRMNFVVAKKLVRQCDLDWETFQKDHLYLNREQRSSAFRSELIVGDEAKKLWMGLIDAMPAITAEEEEPIVNADKVETGGMKVEKRELSFRDFL